MMVGLQRFGRMMMAAIPVFLGGGMLGGCSSSGYYAWNGVKGYQDTALDGAGFSVSYRADSQTDWAVLDEYLQRRCRELLGQQQVRVRDISYQEDMMMAQARYPVGAPLMSPGVPHAGYVIQPDMAEHDVPVKLRIAQGICSAS